MYSATTFAHIHSGTGETEMLELAFQHRNREGQATEGHSSVPAENDKNVSSPLPGSMDWPSSSARASGGSERGAHGRVRRAQSHSVSLLSELSSI